MWASQTLCNSNSTCQVNIVWSCEPHIRMDGVAMAADHCSSSVGSHNWPCTWDARAPQRCSATCGGADGPVTTHGTALGTPRGVGPSRGFLHKVDIVCTLRCSERSASTVMVGRLRIQF